MVKSFKSEVVVEIPQDISLTVDSMKITVEGKKGKVIKDFSHMKKVEILYKDSTVKISSYFLRKYTKAKLGTL
mgnify:CR=1 FL=1